MDWITEPGWTQWVAFVTGILYVFLAARQNTLCWIFGIISCAFIAWDDFTAFRLYADGVLQIVYIALGIAGLVNWLSGSKDGGDLPIRRFTVTWHLLAIGITAVVAVPLSWVLIEYTDATYSYFDTLSTLLSLVATWLLIQKGLANWLYWIAIDSMYVFLFFRTGGKLIAILYVVFTVVAIYGYFEWRKSLSNKALAKTQSE